MGCFNLKCAISNKTIQYGDKVAVLPLIKNEYRSDIKDSIMIYHNDKFNFATLPVFGEYDEYGGIENIESSPGLKDMLNDSNEDVNLDPKDNDELINRILNKQPLMHIKRELYDYLMSEPFRKLLIEEVYGDYIEHYESDSMRHNKADIEAVYNAWPKHKGNAMSDIPFKTDSFSQLNSSAHRTLEDKAGVNIPRSLYFFNQWRDTIFFNDYQDDDFDTYFEKIIQMEHLNTVFETLGVRLFPTLYGSQNNDSDALWDNLYQNMRKDGRI